MCAVVTRFSLFIQGGCKNLKKNEQIYLLHTKVQVTTGGVARMTVLWGFPHTHTHTHTHTKFVWTFRKKRTISIFVVSESDSRGCFSIHLKQIQ